MFESDPVLGRVLALHPSNRARLLLPALVIVGAVSLALNFAFVDSAPVVVMLGTAAIVLVVGWRVLHLWNREVVLYERGFTYREGARTVAFAYGEVATLRQRAERLGYFGGLLKRTVYAYHLTTTAGEHLKLDNLYSSIDRLGARLEERVNAALRPQLEARWLKGESVPFAAELHVTRDGLQNRERTLAWAQCAGYRIEGGALLLLARDAESAWLRLPLDQVDNIALLIETVKRRTG
jgi:hypothetical protein